MKRYKILVLAIVLFVPTTVFAGSFNEQMNAILVDYLKIQKLLASDQTTGIQNLAKAIHDNSKKLSLSEAPKNFGDHFKNVPTQIQSSSLQLSQGKTIEDMRTAFKELSRPIANWVEMINPEDAKVYFCSMAKASWVQKSETVMNPYYGQKMLACGELVQHNQANHDHKH